MVLSNKYILEAANAAITNGDHEGFLSFCTEDTNWVFVGDKTLNGKEAVRQYMKTAYAEPPEFVVENLISEGEFVTAMGKITLKGDDGNPSVYLYCDVWKFRDGKMADLKAFVIKNAK